MGKAGAEVMIMPPIAMIWLLLLSASFTPLGSGTQGPAVSALQTELSRLHFAPGAVDGVYGPETAAAVSRLESQAGLPADGKVGAAVLADIVAKVAASAPVVQMGDKGPAVQDLQSILSADGIKVQADGVFGSATAAAVRQLQAARGIGVDGIAGPATWDALFERSYSVQPGQTIDGIAETYGLPAANLLAANGGSSLILAGQKLELPYAGVPAAGTNPAPATTPVASGSGASQPPSGQGGKSGAKNPGGGQVIPGRTLAQWGGAGTPQLAVVVVAQDQSSALALRKGMPAGMVLALPTSLYSLGGSDKVLLATRSLKDVERTGAQAVLWQGSLSAAALTSLAAQHVTVVVANEETASQALAKASGGQVLAVPVRESDLQALPTLAQGLQKAGYRLASPLP